MANTQAVETAQTNGVSTEVHPSRIPVLENHLEENKVDWEFFPEWPVEEINIPRSRGNQVRDQKDGILPGRVAVLKEALERGSTFPAVVLHAEGRSYTLDDGNHRHEASLQAERKTIGAYLIKAEPEMLYAIRKWCNNNLNGVLPPEEERIRSALHLIDGGMNHDSAAAETGLTVGAVTRAWTIESVNRRLSVVGVRKFKEIPSTIRTKLNSVKSNPVLKRLGELYLTYKTPTVDFNNLIKAVKDIGSDEEALKYLDEREPDLLADFQQRGGGKFQPKTRKGTPYARALGLAHLEALRKLSVVQVNNAIQTPEQAKEFAERCLEVADLLLRVAEEVGG